MKRNVVVAAGLMVALSASVGCASGRTSWTHGTAVVAAATTTGCRHPGGRGSGFACRSAARHRPWPRCRRRHRPQPVISDQAAADVIEIHTFDLGYKPAEVTVPAAGVYTVRLVNDGAIAHDVTFADGIKIAAEAGQTAEGTVEIPAGGTTFSCSVPGHAAAGMTGVVKVAGAPAADAQAQ